MQCNRYGLLLSQRLAVCVDYGSFKTKPKPSYWQSEFVRNDKSKASSDRIPSYQVALKLVS